MCIPVAVFGAPNTCDAFTRSSHLVKWHPRDCFHVSNVILKKQKVSLMRPSLVHRLLLAGLHRSPAQCSRAEKYCAAAPRRPFVSHLDAARMAQGSGCIDLTLSSDSGSPVPALKGTCTCVLTL